MAEPRGRGRLSSIDQLPEVAEPDIVWAVDELRANQRLQKDILDEFNARLADKGITPVSKSAFNRFSTRKARAFRKMDETRRIAKELSVSLGSDDADDLTIMVAEMIKTLVFEILESADGRVSPKGAMELAAAVKSVVQALNISTDHRRKIETEHAKKLAKAVDAAGKSKGLTAETREAIKAQILGIRPKEAEVDG